MNNIEMIGMLDIKGNEQIRRVYDVDGISPTLTTSGGGGNRQPKILIGGKERMIALKVNDLFCGAGGMGLGFKQGGFEIAGAWDFDKYAVESYKQNVGDHVEQADIAEMSANDLPVADVWTFGFPCQDLSVAGKQAGMIKGETRSGLFFEVMRLLAEKKESGQSLPSVIMAENVKMLKKYLPVLREAYEAAGYKMYYTLYNSKFWGVPQNRERYFVVGVHEDIDTDFVFPEQQELYVPRLSTILEDYVDEKYYIADEKARKVIEQTKQKVGLRGTHACITPDRVEKRQNGPRAKDDEKDMFTLTAQDRHGIIELLQEKSGLLNPNDTGRCLRVGGKGSLTPKHNYEHFITNDFRVRKLTPREYARLQGFPETFEFVVSDSQAYKQFGNAVTVNVAQAIAERIRMFLLSL